MVSMSVSVLLISSITFNTSTRKSVVMDAVSTTIVYPVVDAVKGAVMVPVDTMTGGTAGAVPVAADAIVELEAFTRACCVVPCSVIPGKEWIAAGGAGVGAGAALLGDEIEFVEEI